MNPIIEYGQYIRANPPDETFNDEEYEACIRRAFVDNKLAHFTLDSNPRGQRFLAAAASWAIEKGWIVEGLSGGDQTMQSDYWLTEKGKKEMGLNGQSD